MCAIRFGYIEATLFCNADAGAWVQVCVGVMLSLVFKPRQECWFGGHRWQLPLGLIVHPLSESGEEVPTVILGTAGIVRCSRCRTYVNPFVRWIDGGR